MRGEVGKFVSGDTGILFGGFSSQTNICNAFYMLRLRKHIQRLNTLHFIDSACAKNVQVARQRRRVARNIQHLVGSCLAQKLKTEWRTTCARWIDQDGGSGSGKALKDMWQHFFSPTNLEIAVGNSTSCRVLARRLNRFFVQFHSEKCLSKV